MKHRNLVRILAFGLSAALLLCGCEKTDPAASGSPSGSTSPSPGVSENEPQDDGTGDYSKYNSYLKLSKEMSKMLDILDVYFENVAFDEEFALREDGDYTAVKQAVDFYTAFTYPLEEALDYADKRPAYTRVDAAVRALGDSPVKLMEALGDLAKYTDFNDFEDDNMAKAPEIHAAIWEPLQVFMTYYVEFSASLTELADSMRDEGLEELRESGLMILYYSSVMIYSAQDITDDIWDQVEAAAAEADPNADFVLPEIDMTNLSPLFGEFNSAYESLMEAMDDEEEAGKVFTGPVAEGSLKLYKTKVNACYARMGTLAQYLMDNADYADAYDKVIDALNSLIDGYNSI